MTLTRRGKVVLAVAAFVVALVALVGRPALHLATTLWCDDDRREPVASGHFDDASRLDATAVAQVWKIPSDAAAATAQLAALLVRARRDGLGVSIAGARHSMGGHAIWPGGIVVDMRPFAALSYDEERQTLRAGAGALWTDAIAYLNPRGRSVAVMQSFSSFSIGGSISVNAHGWQFREPPLASSVVSMRVMLADGRVVTCSRDEDRELFSLLAGGYGLFGVILEVELRTVPNDRYTAERVIAPAARLEDLFAEKTAPPDAAMAYARLDVSPKDCLRTAILNVFHRLDPEPGVVPPLTSPALAGLRRAVFRGSVGSDYGKELRWDAETRLEEHMAGAYLYRNQVLDDDVSLYEDRSNDTTEILQEYFVPRGRLAAFLDVARSAIEDARADLLNATVREVQEDRDAFLRYADRDMTSVVLLFHQQRSADADAAMEPLTRRLIDAALALGGRHYLPYRLHATKEQFAAAYPRGAAFFDLKRKYDPEGLFRNQFYGAYGR